MVDEADKSATTAVKEEQDIPSAMSENHHDVGGGESEAEEGEIVGSDADDSGKTMEAPPPMHPLEHSWTFWFDNPSAKSKQAAWGSSIRPIYIFFTVEDFWSVFNNIHHPSKLAVGADFHCFKNKIEPKWEDPVCANGGKWTVSFSRGKSDTCWMYTLLAMIGEQFDFGDEICGAVVNVRARQDKISIWTKNAANEAAQILRKDGETGLEWLRATELSQYLIATVFRHKFVEMSIGRQWKEFLDYNDTIGFIFHDDAKKLDRCAKNRYTV